MELEAKHQTTNAPHVLSGIKTLPWAFLRGILVGIVGTIIVLGQSVGEQPHPPALSIAPLPPHTQHRAGIVTDPPDATIPPPPWETDVRPHQIGASGSSSDTTRSFSNQRIAPSNIGRLAENGSYYGQLNSNGVPKTVYVNGYYRRDGTYVRGHYRSAPGSN